jgi:hypothetical protein
MSGGWNWGAFFLTWIWGLSNNVLISFLCFIPIVNCVMPFVLGAYGDEWAWENSNWKDEQHFRRIQRKWAIAGVSVFLIFCLLPIVVGLILMSIAGSLGPSSQAPYMTARDEVGIAVIAYTIDNNADIPALTGTYSIAECADCHPIDMNLLITSSDMILSEVPDGTYAVAGANNDNCDGGATGCSADNHYVWLVNTFGIVYSKCMGADCNSNGDDGYQGVWP